MHGFVGRTHVNADSYFLWVVRFLHYMNRRNPRCGFIAYRLNDIKFQESGKFFLGLGRHMIRECGDEAEWRVSRIYLHVV